MLSGLHREKRLNLVAAVDVQTALADVEMLVLYPKSIRDNHRDYD